MPNGTFLIASGLAFLGSYLTASKNKGTSFIFGVTGLWFAMQAIESPTSNIVVYNTPRYKGWHSLDFKY